MRLIFTISALLITTLIFAQKDLNQEKSLTDSILFDLNQSVVTSVSGIAYIDIPMYIKSTSVVHSFDFWFKYDESKLTYDTVVSSVSSLDPFTSYNANNHFLSNTTSGPNSNYVVPLNTTLLTVRFVLSAPCAQITNSDFNTINTLTNGSTCNYRFISSSQTQQIPAIISTNSFYCSGTSIPFSYPSTISGQNITSYAWDFGNTMTDNNQNTNATYTNDGDYTVTLVSTTALGCTFTAYKYIHVDSSPNASFSSVFNSSNGVTTFTNTSAISTGTINQFDWAFGDNLTAQIENPTHTYSNIGTYNVTLIVTSLVGCSDTITNPITVTEVFQGINELQNSTVKVVIYPNPASKIVSVFVKENAIISLFDLAGNQLSELINIEQNKDYQLNLDQYSTGIYLLKVQNKTTSRMFKLEVIK